MIRTRRALTSAVLVAACSAHAGASDLLVSSRFTNNILRYDSTSGEFRGVFAQGSELLNPNGIAYGPDGNLYVGLGDGDAILRYEGQTGKFLGAFTTPGAGGLSLVRDIEFGPDGDLYVSSAANDRVLRFDGQSGDFLGVAAQGNGLDGPIGLAFDSDGALFVAGALSNRIYVFSDGVFQRSFNAGSAHRNAGGLVFNDAGELLATQTVTNEILAYDAEAGTLDRVLAASNLNIPIYMERGASGELVVGSFGNDSVVRFDAATGAFLGTLVPSGLGGLDGTHDLAFVPVPEPALLPAISVGAGLWLLRRRT
jgi:DNA-binding beta-propeller fold protein YncE